MKNAAHRRPPRRGLTLVPQLCHACVLICVAAHLAYEIMLGPNLFPVTLIVVHAVTEAIERRFMRVTVGEALVRSDRAAASHEPPAVDAASDGAAPSRA